MYFIDLHRSMIHLVRIVVDMNEIRPKCIYATRDLTSAILSHRKIFLPSHFMSSIPLYPWAQFERLRPR